MRFDLITIFPEIFNSYINESILKIAQKKKKIEIRVHNLRDYTFDRHHTVDDKPYGGGPGMLLMVEPFYKALKKIKRAKKSRVIMLDPAGKKFDQKMAHKFAGLDQVIMLCGRYEGFDERIKKLVDERVSIGDFVLSGGELPAMVIVEATARLIPGVLGKAESLKEESFSKELQYFAEYPQYTRPEAFKAGKAIWRVPPVLLSGNHRKISEWRGKRRKN
ncbi:MAG: tRNA (guanosine(37)-N1)-methyltransferase TrmD [Patescibacteria group bacterium]|jgi:tRNA (guanine37-N1)-methyltransferase